MTRREHSAGELLQKLRARGFNESDVYTVIDQLRTKGLQSDDRFAEAFIHSRIEKGYGPVRIRQELRERNISDDLINRYIDMNETSWQQKASQVRKKKYGHGMPTSFNEKAKQSRFLQYRGFTGEQIKHTFNEGEE